MQPSSRMHKHTTSWYSIGLRNGKSQSFVSSSDNINRVWPSGEMMPPPWKMAGCLLVVVSQT
jgi:hypothetical protein